MADSVDRVASAVSDGLAVDWVHEKSRRPDQISAYEQLEVVHRIRKAHSSADPSESTTEVDDDTAELASPPARTAPLFLWGRLETLEKIGEGTCGEVYRAHDPTLKADVALKLLRPDYADSPNLTHRFLDEARRLARVRHPNVVAVYGADTHDGRIGLWTEYITGQSLEELILNQGRMSACEAAVLGLDLCRALAAVHAAGLIHRDVKTTNVMREDGGRIVLMDFGSVAESSMISGPAWATGLQGTPICMAPEQLRGEVAGPPTDVYGLGILLYRLVTKRYPIEVTSLGELGEAHRRGGQVPIRDRRADLPLEFVQVVERALRPDPAERYATAGAMELDLALTLGAMARREGQRRRLQGVATILVASLAVAAGIVIGRALFQPDRSQAPIPPAEKMAAVLPAPLAVDATLMRRAGDREEPVAPGARLTLGDHLSLLVRGNDSMYVYVLNEDAMGDVHNLYPIPGLVPTNPLRGAMRHRLPGDLGKDVVHWTVTSSGGRESIIAIASRNPLKELEEAIAHVPRARIGQPIQFGKIDPILLRSLRGIGSGRALTPPPGEAKERLDAAIRALRAEGEKTGDIWVWSIELANP